MSHPHRSTTGTRPCRCGVQTPDDMWGNLNAEWGDDCPEALRDELDAARSVYAERFGDGEGQTVADLMRTAFASAQLCGRG